MSEILNFGVLFEPRADITKYWIDLKMVSSRPQRILMNLQLPFESVLIAIFVKISVNVLGGAHWAPPPTLFRVDKSKPATFPYHTFF
jgi:hypothetical protein